MAFSDASSVRSTDRTKISPETRYRATDPPAEFMVRLPGTRPSTTYSVWSGTPDRIAGSI
jgi:hypothetical protein